ncbi:MAG: CRISPR-associated endonuclease Cas1 [Phycisphaeraceae bacterium]|nr:CRISPR-associated endonuclease Cas1 [Phycisphaeraceae bacterium]
MISRPAPPDAVSPPAADSPDLLPVRMLNEFAYCPRLFHLMHVEGRWADNTYTVEGRAVHRRVDKLDHVLPNASQAEPEAAEGPDAVAACEGAAAPTSKRRRTRSSDDNDEPPTVSRSVSLGSDLLGLTAKLDLVATAPRSDVNPAEPPADLFSLAQADVADSAPPVPDCLDEAVPVETKRGRVPNNPERSYEPERVQLMAQGLLLREHGYHCDHGVLYFAGSRSRVDVPFTPELEARTLTLLAQARQACHAQELPPPLDDSPKCHGCSLAAICLPDETLALQHVPADPVAPNVRRLYPARDEALPLYVQEQGAYVGKSNDNLIIRMEKQEIARARLKDVSQLVLLGNVSISTQTIHLLCEANIPIVYLSTGHWFSGITHGITLRNAYDRAAQFAAAATPGRCLEFARQVVAAKGSNQRTLVRRNGSPPDRALSDMADLITASADARDLPQLLGVEGNLAARYFEHFSTMLRPRDFDAIWDFANRNRRPPRDPVNAMLSFGYALLAKECTVALLAEGLDPWWGFYHQPRHGRPALALDLMEEFRPLVVDSAVITAVNTGMVAASDFLRSKAGCVMKDTARKSFIHAYEARLDQLVTHPVFDYRCSWRNVVRLQARLLARWLRGDVPTYTPITTR